MNHIADSETLKSLSSLGTCAVSNAIETFDVRLRNEGYTNSTVQCRFPQLPPMVGYAVTLRVRSASPPWKGHHYIDRTDWWKNLEPFVLPHVMVIQDMDANTERGAFVGEVHAGILQALGCVGVVTNGAVRDLPEVARTGFHLFSRSVSVSHSYVHVVEYGTPVEVAGLKIKPGDLLHGDQHGIVNVPLEIATEIPKVATALRRREKVITTFCHSKDFSVPELGNLIDQTVYHNNHSDQPAS